NLLKQKEFADQFRGPVGPIGPVGPQGLPGPVGPVGASPSASQVFGRVGVIPPNPATNFAGATLFSATNLSSSSFSTGTGNITTLNVSGDSTLTGSLAVTGATTYSTLSGGNITDSGLTATRVTFAGTAGLLSDDADLTFATDTLSATKLLSATSVSTPSLISTGAVGITPASGSNLNVTLATTGDLAVNTDDLYVDTSSGNVGIGVTAPTAKLHLVAGTATANTAPLKLTSGALNTTAEAGAIEFLTDAYYGTITTGAVRKTFAFTDSSITGSAATLTTARAIYGNNFDGSAALTQVIASTYGGTGNGFTKFSGPTTAERTFTLPDASATVLTSNAAVTVAQGGTNATSASITAFNNITGYTSSGATGTTSTNLVFSTSPTLVTPVLGAATGTSLATSAQNIFTAVASTAPVIIRSATSTDDDLYLCGPGHGWSHHRQRAAGNRN
ncbi:hypothetical protein HYW72_00530, partial [Candidatus Nomurabacteria bacterium]|nr:hypothetical protein [Candidatus Nomurabacteria bacterium]